jgi:ATP-dependent RNA helicase DDX55/SPB4
MTPVQASTIPLFLNYKDCIVQAVTGSGKTLAFLVPILQILHRKIMNDEKPLGKNKIYALVLAPTRELATQINSVLAQLLEMYLNEEGESCIKKENSKSASKKNSGAAITSGLLIGGTSVREDIESFSKSGAHILIATPGRVQDLFSAHPSLFNVRELEVLVMDEADRLLDLGFERQLMSILAMLPKQRRTCLFSATMSEGLARIVKAGLRNPVKVSVKVD